MEPSDEPAVQPRFRSGSISFDSRLDETWAVTEGMVALLVLAWATVASAEQPPAESVTRTIDDVLHIITIKS